jgi:cystathionine beta-lyase
MKYDFDVMVDRKNTNSLKYDFARERGVPEDALPMWVADMDFPAPPQVLDDIHKAVSHGIFGYTEVKDDYYDAVLRWFSSRYDVEADKRSIVKSPGVVYALAQSVRAFTNAGDAVIFQTPVYYPFYSVTRDNGRKVVENPLIYADGKYTLDFEDFEAKIEKHAVKLFILCNPHNPIGRVWTRAELERLNAICAAHGVTVVSDEIHCDFVYPGHVHTSFARLSDDAVIATAPSKTFNLAGLHASNIFIKNEALREKFADQLNQSGYSQSSALGLVACQSAYAHGGEWLEQLRAYLCESIRLTGAFLSERLPKVKLVKPEGTYLLWLDFSAYGLSPKELDRRIAYGAKLWLDGGTMFGTAGAGFQRVNIACPRATLSEALNRLYREFGT